jgi:type II secretory pathway pseudopilin PulG
MGGMTVLWIGVALAVLVILVALIAGTSRKSSKAQEERDRQEEAAQEARSEAEEHWADGQHPDDPRRQAYHPEGHDEPHHPKHSKH